MNCADEVASRGTAVDAARRIGLSWPMLLGAMAFVGVLAGGVVQIGPDTYWHIVVGRWILAHGYVPTHDPFSFTMRGAPWVAQEWGAELLMALVYGATGWSGLTLVTAALFGLTIAYLARFLLSRMRPVHAVLLTVLSGCMMLTYILVRPHEFVWPLTVLWVGVLIDASENRRTPPWWLLGVMLLWANLHASFILGLGLAGVIGAEAVVNAKEQWKPAAWRWGTFVAAAFVCALLNPQDWRLLIFPFHVLGMHALSQWTEWKPPNLQKPQIFSLWLLAVFGLSFAGRFRLSFVRAVLLIGLIFVALQHARNVSLLGLIAPFLIAAPFAALWRGASVLRHDTQSPDRVLSALGTRGNLRALCLTVVLAGALGIVTVSVKKPRPMSIFTPRAALNAVLAKRPNARIFNDSIFGGYLIFRGIPVFVDSRMTVYGDAFIRRYMGALELTSDGSISTLLEKYRINAILIAPGWPVVRLLDRSSDWKQIYADKIAVAYVRKGEKS